MSLCCEYCFNDDYLKGYIKENGQQDDCDFCGKKKVYCIKPTELKELFEPLVKLYTPIEDFMPGHDLKERDGDFLWEKLTDDWELFEEYNPEKSQQILEAIFEPFDKDDLIETQFLHSYVERESEYWGDDFEHNEKLKKEWEEFTEEIIYKNRFFPTRTIDVGLLKDLLPFFTEDIAKDLILYRARISDTDKKYPCDELGKPSVEKSKKGRANPIGIPYLYVASDRDTVIAEVRPSIGDKVTVGEFSVISPLKVIDLRNPKIDSPFRYKDELEHVFMHIDFIRILGHELSKPINRGMSDIEYIPTQYLCELIKNNNYDGVIYESSMGSGYNLAIFNDAHLKCINTEMYLIEKAKYSRVVK